MDAIFTQENRTLKLTTPLGEDVLLLAGLSGQEAISSLFQFHLDLLAENRRQINFDELLGKKVAIEVMLPDDKTRYFSGYLNSFSQGAAGPAFYAVSRRNGTAVLVPHAQRAEPDLPARQRSRHPQEGAAGRGCSF